MSSRTESKIPPRLPRTVVMLGIVSLFMDMSSELIHSLLPALFVTVLGANMAMIGLIEGVAEATASITKVFSGVLSDWLGKRKMLAVVGYGMAAITKPLFPLATSIPVVFAARFIDRIGKGIRGAPRDALIADVTPEDRRGAAYGLRQSLDTAGAFMGPLAAIALMALFADDVRTVLWFAVIPAAICMVILIFAVEDAKTPPRPASAKSPINKRELKQLPSAFWAIVFIGGLFSLTRFSEAFLTLRGMELGLPLAMTPMAILLMSLIYALSSYPAGKISDKINRRFLLIIGLVVMIVADLFLAVADDLTFVFLGIAAWGLHMGLTQGVLSAMVAEAAPKTLRGTAFGIFNLISGIVLLAASVIAGLVWDMFGSQMTFLMGGSFAVLSILAVLWTTRRGKPIKYQT